MNNLRGYTERTFIEHLNEIPWMQPQGDPKDDWLVFDTREEAEQALYLEAERRKRPAGMIKNTARHAMLQASKIDRERMPYTSRWRIDNTWGAIWHKAYDIVRKAIDRDSLKEQGYPILDIVADDDASYTIADCVFIMEFVSMDQEHVDTILRRFEVWERGYGLLCDVDGVLYVYRRVV